jgi:hypothetical protein
MTPVVTARDLTQHSFDALRCQDSDVSMQRAQGKLSRVQRRFGPPEIEQRARRTLNQFHRHRYTARVYDGFTREDLLDRLKFGSGRLDARGCRSNRQAPTLSPIGTGQDLFDGRCEPFPRATIGELASPKRQRARPSGRHSARELKVQPPAAKTHPGSPHRTSGTDSARRQRTTQ